MTRWMGKAVWIVVPAALATVAGVVSGTAASAHFGCTVRSAPSYTNPRAVRAFAHACFPKKISGSFSGTGTCMTWEGTVSVSGRERQTTWSYKGRAKYQWKYKAPNPCVSSDCTASPDHGTINETAYMAMNLGSDKRGWSYDGGNDPAVGGVTVPITITCSGGSPNPPEPDRIEGAFAPGGFTKDLRTFAGSVKSGKNVFKWSFHGTR